MKIKPFVILRENPAYIFNLQKPYGVKRRMRCLFKEGINLNMVACAAISYILGAFLMLLIFR